MSRKPAVGDDVHYVSYGTPGGEFASQCRAAKVTEVEFTSRALGGDRVGLIVFNPTGVFLHSIAAGGCVQREDSRPGGSWHWPDHH